MPATKRDASTLGQKVALRRLMLSQAQALDPSFRPVVMETHGGIGQIWAQVYAGLPAGVVFENNEEKAAHLARQRPNWAVYEADCVTALAYGAGGHLQVTVLDLDPYGEPWPAMEAFFASDRPRPDVLWVVVNDGLRAACRGQGACPVGGRPGPRRVALNRSSCVREKTSEPPTRAGVMVLAVWI